MSQPAPTVIAQRPIQGSGALVCCVIVLLCLQLCLSLAPIWHAGEYYSYGWFVPLLAGGLAWRRWRMLGDSTAPSTTLRGPMVMLGLGSVVLILVLRCLATVDPGWRPVLVLQALFTAALCHALLAQLRDWRTSLAMLPITIFALSAVPYPWQVEQQIIRSLTGVVASITRELFHLTGKPVELIGERLFLGTDSVGIAEGCSGIRSLQSLIMVALFFGELLLLSWQRRLALLAIGIACAVTLNVLRAFTLGSIHFSRGGEATDAAHDPAGHTAFAVSAILLFLAARFLANPSALGRRKVVRLTRQTAAPPSVPSP